MTSNPNEIYKTIAKLREKYPDADDIERIDRDSARVRKLLAKKEYFNQETTQEFIAVARQDILTAKKKLASDKSLVGDEKAQRELWFLIESREWFLNMVSEDYDGELNTLQTELEAELER